MRWDTARLFDHLINALKLAGKQDPNVAAVAVDSWGSDYGLVNAQGLLGEPLFSHSERNTAGAVHVHAKSKAYERFQLTGVQDTPASTLNQLAEDGLSLRLSGAKKFLMVADFFSYFLSGREIAERTNASTTGLYNIQTKEWDERFIRKVGLPRKLFADLVDPGETLGPLLPTIAVRTGLFKLEVFAVGSHDIASAVVAVPAPESGFAYISCGTATEVGVELERPVISEETHLAGFSNGTGVDRRVRFFRQEQGLAMLSQCLTDWKIDLDSVVIAAHSVPTPVRLIDVNDPFFLAFGGMPARIAAWCASNDVPVPTSPPGFVRLILESLACAYSIALHQACHLSGRSPETVYLVGDGSRIALLCQLIADYSQMLVRAGPAEASAIGNVLVQARGRGIVSGSLESLRAIVAHEMAPIEYSPASAGSGR